MARKKKSPKTSDRTIDTVSTSASSLQTRGPLKVTFDIIEVREYPIKLGDNPCPSDGPSLTIAWKFQKKKIFNVDYFESKRTDRRRREELVIPADARIQLLQRNGFSSEAIEEGMRKTEEARRQREKSVANMHWDFVSATKEKIGRKLTSVFHKRNNKITTAINAC